MKVMHIISSANPDTGGPIAYAVNMAHQRLKHNHQSVFVTTDAPDSDWVQNFPFEIHATGKKKCAFRGTVETAAKECDVAIIHGLWNDASILGWRGLRKTDTPWIIFPHGMLDPYFRVQKPIKNIVKQIYWWLFQGRMFSHAYKVIFTCEEEKRRARGAFRGHQDYNEFVTAYCAVDQEILSIDRTKLPVLMEQLDGQEYLLYLSRIHPKKAVDNLLSAFAVIKTFMPRLVLVMAGPDNSEYAAAMKAHAVKLNISDSVIWAGMLEGDVKKKAFSYAKAFILPSHQENFGQVVAEALSASTPVLISYKVNIWREIIEDGAGLACDDTVAGTTNMLREFFSMTDHEREEMKRAARPCYENRFSVTAAYKSLESILEGAINTSQKSS